MNSKILYWSIFVATCILTQSHLDQIPALVTQHRSLLGQTTSGMDTFLLFGRFILPALFSAISLPLIFRRIYMFIQSKSASPPPLGKLAVFFFCVFVIMVFVVYGTRIIPPLRQLAFGAGILKLFFPIPILLAFISCELSSFSKSPALAVTSTDKPNELVNANEVENLGSETEPAKRPTSITVICAIGFVGTLASVPLIFTSISQQIGAWYPPYLAFTAIVSLVCIGCLWMMKKWAAYAYIGFVILNQVALLAMGSWSVKSVAVSAIMVFVALTNINRMS